MVTADSVSMLSDACRSGHPVDIFDLPGLRTPSAALKEGLARLHLRRPRRNARLVSERLLEMGAVGRLGEGRGAAEPSVQIAREAEETLRRVRALLTDR